MVTMYNVLPGNNNNNTRVRCIKQGTGIGDVANEVRRDTKERSCDNIILLYTFIRIKATNSTRTTGE